MPDVVRPDQITPAWLGTLLGCRVDSVTATPVGTGQVGATYRLALTGNGAPASLIGKFAAVDDVSRATGIAQNSYRRETGFYAQLAAGRDLPVPDMHHVAFDEQTHDFALIMGEIKRARAGDQLIPLSRAEAEPAVDAIAAIHRAFWMDARLDTLDWLPGSASLPHAPVDGLYAMLWPAFVDRYAARVTGPMREVGEAYLGQIDAWITADGPRTLVHGDYRHDNLLFAPDGGVTVVDWQTCAVGRGVRDLAYFMGTSIEPADRAAWEAGLFNRWLDTVGGDRNAEWRAYRRDAFAGFLMAVAASMIVGRTDRGDAMFLAMGERAAAMVLDHGAIGLI